MRFKKKQKSVLLVIEIKRLCYNYNFSVVFMIFTHNLSSIIHDFITMIFENFLFLLVIFMRNECCINLLNMFIKDKKEHHITFKV